MSITDEYCASFAVNDKEKIEYYKTCLLLWDMLGDLNTKGYLRAELRSANSQRTLITNVIMNVRKITQAFNDWFDIYVDKAKPNSKQKLKKIIQIGEITDEDAVVLLFSDMIFVFLQNIEQLRFSLLHTLKLPIRVTDRQNIDKGTTLNQLLTRLSKLSVMNANEPSKIIEGDLRNGLSHGLFWFETKDAECSELHLHYSKNSEFTVISKAIGISELFQITRRQSMYTNCLLNVIADWFT